MLFNKLSIYTKFFNVSIVIVIHLHSRRICKLHRIAEAIQVSVVVQPVILVSDERIGAEETACGWLVDTSVHVDESQTIEMLMHGIASRQQMSRCVGLCPVVRITSRSPRIVCKPVNYIFIVVHKHHEISKPVCEGMEKGICSVCGDPHSYQSCRTSDVVNLPDSAVGIMLLLVIREVIACQN